MELKELLISSLVICIVSVKSVFSDPIQYHDHLGIGLHNVVVDYYSKPQYAFGYEVDGLDEYFRELSHGRWEVRDGDVTKGQYRVLLPDGRIQIVSYIADKFGYRPNIQYVNKGALPPPPPAFAKIRIPHIAPIPAVIQEPVPIIQPVDPYIGSTYGASYGYGLDPLLPLGSGNRNRIAKKRALLYDRTLFRKDVERKRRSQQHPRAFYKSKLSSSPVTVTVAPSPVGTKKQRRVVPVVVQEETDQELH